MLFSTNSFHHIYKYYSLGVELIWVNFNIIIVVIILLYKPFYAWISIIFIPINFSALLFSNMENL
jgi:hypothetical protein